MKFKNLLFLLPAFLINSSLNGQESISDIKKQVINSVETHKNELTHLSDQIWEFAETALKEYNSSKVLADYAKAQGFRVERGVADMPTVLSADTHPVSGY